MFWQQNLNDIFTTLSPQDRKNVAQQILAPKHIFWNADKKAFEYKESVQTLAQAANAVPTSFKKLKVLANQVAQSLSLLQNDYHEATQIADYLENMLEKIQLFDCDNDLEQHICKQNVYRAFIYAAADVIRNKQNLELPPNARKLHVNAVKVFINEVYLKQQLLGYAFKTVRNRQLLAHPHPLMSQFLAHKQKTRQLEVVRASGYLFAIAPMLEYSSNPFGIRRFLEEERLFGGSLLLHGASYNAAYLSGSRPPTELFFQKQIEFIITIQGNIRKVVMDFMEQLDVYHEERLLTLLFAPFGTSSGSLQQEVHKRLADYEKLLTVGILEPLANSLRRLPNHQDEFDFIYVSMRQLLGKMIAALQDFQMQPALLLDDQVKSLLGRLTAYATFLEKRRSDVFAELEQNQWAENHKQTLLPMKHVRGVAKDYLDEYRKRKYAVDKQQRLLEQTESLLDKLFKRKAAQERELEELKKDLRKVQYEAHKQLCYPPESVLQLTVRMEFETQLNVRPEERNLAFPDGDNGVSRLPMVLTLPENRLQFDVNAFAKAVNVGEHEDEEKMLHEAEKVLLKRT